MVLNLGCALQSPGEIFFLNAAARAPRDLDLIGVGMAQAPTCLKSSPGDSRTSQVAQLVKKNPPAMQDTWVQS